jgi:hypothetical protein
MTKKRCNRCKATKPLTEFYKRTKSVDGRQSHCKDCAVTSAKDYALASPEATREKNRRYNASEAGKHRSKVARAKKYGMTIEDLWRAELMSRFRCAICGIRTKKLEIDHCHTSLRARGLLCGECNKGLGKFKDSPELLRTAADYLERHD